MKLTKAQIKEQLKELREVIDNPNTPPMEKDIAYTIECAVRYVTEDTEDWPTLTDLAASDAASIFMTATNN